MASRDGSRADGGASGFLFLLLLSACHGLLLNFGPLFSPKISMESRARKIISGNLGHRLAQILQKLPSGHYCRWLLSKRLFQIGTNRLKTQPGL